MLSPLPKIWTLLLLFGDVVDLEQVALARANAALTNWLTQGGMSNFAARLGTRLSPLFSNGTLRGGITRPVAAVSVL
jgi:hypothetical protein